MVKNFIQRLRSIIAFSISQLGKYFKAIQKNPFYQIRYDNIRCLPLKIFPAMIHFSINEEEQLIVVHAVIGTRKNSKGNWV